MARLVSTADPPTASSSDSESDIVELNTNYDADYYSPDFITVDSSTSKPMQDPSTHTFVIDSGATDHMCNSRSLFTDLKDCSQSSRVVTLGDGKRQCPILGIGTIEFMTSSKFIRLHDVLYVPNLDVSLYSVKLHMTVQGCFEHSENNHCTVAFPHFSIDANVNKEITFTATIPPSPCPKPDFDNSDITLNIMNQHITYHFTHRHSSTVQISSSFKKKRSRHYQADPHQDQ